MTKPIVLPTPGNENPTEAEIDAAMVRVFGEKGKGWREAYSDENRAMWNLLFWVIADFDMKIPQAPPARGDPIEIITRNGTVLHIDDKAKADDARFTAAVVELVNKHTDSEVKA